jgi:hypothetical protein
VSPVVVVGGDAHIVECQNEFPGLLVSGSRGFSFMGREKKSKSFMTTSFAPEFQLLTPEFSCTCHVALF